MRRKKLFMGIAATTTLATLLFGCAGDMRRGEPIGRPVIIDTHQAARGEVVYMRHCYACHQTGEGGLGPAIPNCPIPKPIVWLQVRAGLGAMPAFPEEQISSQEFDDLYAYLQARTRS